MARPHPQAVLKALIYGSIVCFLFLSSPFYTDAAISDWQRGVSIQPASPTQFASESFRQTLINLKADNANYVNLVIPIYQSNIYASDISAGADTPTDDTLGKAIDMAHAVGLKVSLKPHIESRDYQWRAMIDPTDRALWFTNYGTFIKRYAQIAQAHGAEQLIVGTELIKLSSDDYNAQNTPRWRSLISNVRTLYSGSLVYAANWGAGTADEKNRITFWDALDVVGIDAYYPLGSDYSDISVENYRAYWAAIDQGDIQVFQKKVNRPIVFTEIGYRSTTGTHIDPGNYQHTDGVNLQEQVNLYEALFSYWNDKPYIGGMHMWNFTPDPLGGGINDVDYTPQGKPAELVMKKWFGTTTVTSFPVKPISSITGPVFNVITSVPPGNLYVGNQISFNTNVANSGSSASNVLIDVEIYDAQNNKIYQKVYENQTLDSSVSKSFTTNWTPNSVGNYKVKVGVFNNNWSKNYIWQENAQQFSTTAVSGTVTTPVINSFNASASVNSTIVNKPISVTSLVTNSGSNAAGLLVDVEVYNPQNQKVAQQVFENESIAGSQSKPYILAFTPTVTGTYQVKVGVFQNGWSTNILWKENAGNFVVNAEVVTPPVVVVPVVTPPVTPTSTASTTPPVVAPVIPSCPTTYGTSNFVGCYYDNQDFSNLKFSRTDTTLNFDWGGGSPDVRIDSDTFSATWKGNFDFEAGTYQFNTTVDDGVKLYIDNELVLDKWFDQVGNYSVNKTLVAGTHAIRYEYYEHGGGAQAKLSWVKISSNVATPLPTPTVTCPTDAPSGTFAACYFDNKDLTNLKVTKNEANINFDWGGGSPDSSIESDTFSASWKGLFAFDNAPYQFNVTSDDGVRVYIDNELVLDKWFNQVASYQVNRTLAAGQHLIKVEYYDEGGGARMQMSWQRNGSIIIPTVVEPVVVPPVTPPVVVPPATIAPSVTIISPSGSVTGQQSFKAYVQGKNLADYAMFWQVDGDRLNSMYDSGDGVPHKEANVDLTGWNWKGRGPYTINFVAKDNAGATLAQQSVDISI